MARASQSDGQSIVLDPVQVVGRKCMESGETILYEPDSRVCQKCERIYHKSHVPETCACGASLAALRPGGASKKAAPSSATPESDDKTSDKSSEKSPEKSPEKSAEKTNEA